MEDKATYTALIGTYPDRPRKRSTPGIVSPRLMRLSDELCGYLHVKQIQNPRVIEREYSL